MFLSFNPQLSAFGAFDKKKMALSKEGDANTHNTHRERLVDGRR